MLMSPPDIFMINDELNKTNRRIINIERKLFAREQELIFYGKNFQDDFKYRALYDLAAHFYKKFNYWLNFLGEFKEN